MAFLLMRNFCFHEAQVPWNDIFLDYNSILVALTYVRKYCQSYFPITQITYDYGFPYIKPQAAVPSFLLSSCS